jgi:hypothetical protein
MSYSVAVKSIPAIRNCFREGLQALGTDSGYVSVANTRNLNGSVDIDTCLLYSLPSASRWDYTFGYNNQSYYLEIHPAGTGEVDVVINKFIWLKGWLRTDGVQLNVLNAPNPFHWVASGKVAIAPGSTYAKRLASAGLAIPKTRLVL